MEIYQGIILGIVQGLTEFLPVSSSGHLVLGQIYFNITEFALLFDVSVHMGTLAAVVVVYFLDIKLIFESVFRFLAKAFARKPFAHLFKTDENLKFAAFIMVGSVPTALIGFVLKQFEHILFTSDTVVGCMLVLTGAILWFSKRYYHNEKTKTVFDIKRAVFIGIVQGFAVVPGISRSGSTIAAGMYAGLDRSRAAKFSFLLSIPAILGAQVLSLKDAIKTGLIIEPATIYGTIVSFIVGLIALKLLLKLVHRGKFHLFAPYCWLVGILVLLSKII
jgi:undecaprenyl-diphosphatase